MPTFFFLHLISMNGLNKIIQTRFFFFSIVPLIKKPTMSLHTVITIFILIVSYVLSCHSKYSHKLSSYSFSGNAPLNKFPLKLSKILVGDDGRFYACAERNFFAFDNNGSIAWSVKLNYSCNPNIAPVYGGSRKIYLVSENLVLKIYSLLKDGSYEAQVEVFFGREQGGEIIGVSVSISSSCVLITVKNRGLFAYRFNGQLLWSAGPVLYRNGYRQGCRRNVTDCYFTSAPVIDHCEASIYMLNNVGELYSLSVRGLYFKWIQDLSSFGSLFTITAGNNGRVYVTIPVKALVLALDVSKGTILWEGHFGPLSSADYEPTVDANGWMSIGSLDGFLYSFSPTGALRKFPKSAGLNSVIQVNPVLDCSGYAVYISRTELEGKTSTIIGEYTYVSAMKSRNSVFTMLNPASGSVYFSETDSGKFLMKLTESDLQNFVLDESTVLTFLAVSRNGNSFPCRTTRHKHASSCSVVEPKNINIYTGNERTIALFLLFESIVLVLLAASVRHCCIFWKKRKLQSLDLRKFLEKRHSLRLQKKAFDRTISELEQKASEEAVANEVLEKLGSLVKERERVKKKLSTTYSLGRDGEYASSKSLLPLSDEKSKSYSFQDSKKGTVTIFHTVSTSSEDSDDEKQGENRKGKGVIEVDSSGDDEIHGECSSTSFDLKGSTNPLLLERSCSENGAKMNSDEKAKMGLRDSRSLRRRSFSMN